MYKKCFKGQRRQIKHQINNLFIFNSWFCFPKYRISERTLNQFAYKIIWKQNKKTIFHFETSNKVSTYIIKRRDIALGKIKNKEREHNWTLWSTLELLSDKVRYKELKMRKKEKRCRQQHENHHLLALSLSLCTLRTIFCPPRESTHPFNG